MGERRRADCYTRATHFVERGATDGCKYMTIITGKHLGPRSYDRPIYVGTKFFLADFVTRRVE